MKLDIGLMTENEHARGVETPPRKSYNPFDSDDEDTDSYSKSSINHYDIKAFETTSDTVTFHLDGHNLSWEEAIIEQSHILSNSVTSDFNIEEVFYRKDNELYNGKTITECKVPELVFSYKDDGFNSVKDIGIDEGVTNHDKGWIKCERSRPNNEIEKDLAGQAQLKGPKSRPNNEVEKDLAGQARSEGPVKEKGHEHEVLEKPNFADQSKTDLQMVDEFEHDLSNIEIDFDSRVKGTDLVESDDVANGKKDVNINDKDKEERHKVEKTVNGVSEEKYCNDNVPLQVSEKYLAKPSIEHKLEAKVDSNKNQSNETASVHPLDLPTLKEPVVSGIADTSSYNSSVNSRSIILDFNTSFKVSGKEEDKNPRKHEEVEKPRESQTKSRDDGIALGPSILNSGTEKNMVHGEMSFSAAMPLPASITYVGPNAHNGSVSLRSESSAGSTRSFAFPVLQTEWNTSPVRMAKADQRHFRKQRGWVHSLICCKY